MGTDRADRGRHSRANGQHALVGAYALDAVPEPDRARFEKHLLSCEQCRDDVHGLREATARLASAAAVPPRPGLREQTVQAATRTRQLPPLVSGQPEQRIRGWGRARSRLRRARASSSRTGSGMLRSWSARLVLGAAVLLAVTATVLGLHLGAMQNRITAAQQRDNTIAAIVGASDATRMTAPVSTGGMATVVMSHHARALVFVGRDLAALPGSQRYELWLMAPSGSAPAGMLSSAQHGMSGPMVVRRLAPGDRLGLTIEPVSGASHPTSAPIVVLALGG
jgi:anti-sigma factor RsiW